MIIENLCLQSDTKMRLYFIGKCLRDNCQIADYYMQDGSTIEMKLYEKPKFIKS